MQVRGEIYHQLLVLLQEQTECGFRLKLQQVVSNLMDKELRFCQYFKAEYVSRLEQWATFARVNVGINTNMMVESFHRKLKVCYLQHKQNRRVDTLLHTLTRISRNLIFECFIKSEKGKVTHRVSEINRRHRAAEKLYETGLRAISTESGNEWKIGAQSLKEELYTIRRLLTVCKCHQYCTKCSVCVHMYTCSCMDSAIHCTVCKHVHVLMMQSELQDASHQCGETSVGVLEIERYSFGVEDNLKKAIRDKVLTLTDQIGSCSDCSTLAAVSKHLDSAICVLQAHETYPDVHGATTLAVRKRLAPNASHEIQKRFFPTKRPCKKPIPALSKPSSAELASVEQKLSTVDVRYVVCVTMKMMVAVMTLWNGLNVCNVKFGSTICVLV
ncbi:hypothetical protein SPONN_1055 [uncultured Candidatus Thioglobus sp.]|nr:hypothetical protein SPONN_1055 [uncultured Candidatus Thioglobus sp.]